MDASDDGENVASMGRLLRADFDIHFAHASYLFWMERDGQASTIFREDERSEAPLYYMRFRVSSPSGQHQQRRGLLVAPCPRRSSTKAVRSRLQDSCGAST
jgi:hypothetical protein